MVAIMAALTVIGFVLVDMVVQALGKKKGTAGKHARYEAVHVHMTVRNNAAF
jgi:NADH:ubiquinone oxidoreductase subunit 3 (subunit A)